MMNMDIAALGAAPPPDTSCAPAETSAGAADAFAALLDEVSATGEEEALPDPRTGEDDGEENFDELAALAMTSLLNIGAMVPPATDAGDADEIPAEIADAEITATNITGQTVVTDLTARAVPVAVGMSSQWTTPSTTIGNDMGVDTSVAPVMTDTTAAATAPETTPEAASTDAAPTDAAPNDAATGTPIAAAEAKPGAKASRSSKPSRAQQAHDTHKADALNADAGTASSPASVAQAQTTDAARASAPTQQTSDVRASGSTAARLARALERAAAPAASEAASNAASTANANGGGSEQPSGFGGSTPDQSAQFSAAGRQSAPNVMAFTVNGPVPFDTRAMAAVAAATGRVDNAPVAIPERDVIAQLVQSMRVQFRDGIGEAVVKLNPEHLGSVQISLRIENGAIRATVQAEAPAVRQWLESQQEMLRTSLADQGLRLERFVVEPDGERQTAPDDDAREQKEQRRRQQQRRMSDQDLPLFEVTV